jgi:hypothetical protein
MIILNFNIIYTWYVRTDRHDITSILYGMSECYITQVLR